jgi:hypothetical protein
MDSSCTNCTRLLLKIGKVSGFLFHDRLRSCSTSSNSLELPGFLDELVAYPTASHYVLHLSVTEYSNILQNRWLLKNELSKPNTAFTFDHSIIALNFSCKNLEKLYDFFPNDAKQKKDSSDYDIS